MRRFDRFYPGAFRSRFRSAGLRIRSLLTTNFRSPGMRNFRSWPGLISHVAALSADGESREDTTMLSWVVTFLVVALIAGILGFGGIAGASVEIAKAIFFIAVILFLISAVVGLVRGRTQV
jgi:uncharacterized membrane protein YtjA (UPF0391 family)